MGQPRFFIHSVQRRAARLPKSPRRTEAAQFWGNWSTSAILKENCPTEQDMQHFKEKDPGGSWRPLSLLPLTLCESRWPPCVGHASKSPHA